MSGRVIVIEADPLVRDLLDEWLAEAGFEVLVQSLPLAMQAPGVALVLLDLVNLRVSGRETIVHVRLAYPNTPVLGISTQAADMPMANSQAAFALGLDLLLPKPCSRLELLHGVRYLLARGRA